MRYGRLSEALDVPPAVLASLSIDPQARPRSALLIVKSHVGGKAWREAMATRSQVDRTAILLGAARARREADEGAS